MRQYKYLTYDDRKRIEKWYLNGAKPADIAEKLKVHTATVYHELSRGYTGKNDKSFRPEYSAEKAQHTIQDNFKRRGRKPKKGGFDMNGKWQVTYNPACGTKLYAVYRIRNVNEADHSGNREYASDYMASKEDAQKLADKLNSEEAE